MPLINSYFEGTLYVQEPRSSLDDDDDERHLSKLIIRACWEHAWRRKSDTATATAQCVTAQSEHRVRQNVREAPLIFHFYTDCARHDHCNTVLHERIMFPRVPSYVRTYVVVARYARWSQIERRDFTRYDSSTRRRREHLSAMKRARDAARIARRSRAPTPRPTRLAKRVLRAWTKRGVSWKKLPPR